MALFQYIAADLARWPESACLRIDRGEVGDVTARAQLPRRARQTRRSARVHDFPDDHGEHGLDAGDVLLTTVK